MRQRRIPYLSVDEARKALLPDGARLQLLGADPEAPPSALKSFDFVIYGSPVNLLVDVKGRQLPASRSRTASTARRLESWVTQDDVDSLAVWESLFGDGFQAAFLFLYLCEGQPPDALFQEIFEDRERWYAIRSITLADYRSCMKVRSPRWRTVDLPAAEFQRLSRPFSSDSLQQPDPNGGFTPLGLGHTVPT